MRKFIVRAVGTLLVMLMAAGAALAQAKPDLTAKDIVPEATYKKIAAKLGLLLFDQIDQVADVLQTHHLAQLEFHDEEAFDLGDELNVAQ